MSFWICPHCDTEHDYSHNPDVTEGLGASGKVWFVCDCGCEFDMWVDWDPTFTVDRESVKLPAAEVSTDV